LVSAGEVVKTVKMKVPRSTATAAVATLLLSSTTVATNNPLTADKLEADIKTEE
jgi:hypothetical protein